MERLKLEKLVSSIKMRTGIEFQIVDDRLVLDAGGAFDSGIPTVEFLPDKEPDNIRSESNKNNNTAMKNLITEIEKLKHLTDEKKTEIITKLERIEEHKEARFTNYDNGNNTSLRFGLYAAFTFGMTEEGHDYWHDVSLILDVDPEAERATPELKKRFDEIDNK